MIRFSRIESLFDLAKELSDITANAVIKQSDFKTLNDELNTYYEHITMNSRCEGHPGWSAISGDAANKLFLLRNWHYYNRADRNKQEFRRIADEIYTDFRPAVEKLQKVESTIALMEYLDKSYAFSEIVLRDRCMLIFCLDCCHRQYDSFCRSYELADGKIGADIYMSTPFRDDPVTVESVFLHELGHVLNTMLTGSIFLVPDDFLSIFQPIFPGIENFATANEIFAHCFAMAVMTHPEFRMYDPFLKIHQSDKMLFDLYFRAKLKFWGSELCFDEKNF